MPNDYEIARQARKHSPTSDQASGKLPPSRGESVKPDFLLSHENHFDRNVVTPENLIQGGILEGKQPVKTT